MQQKIRPTKSYIVEGEMDHMQVDRYAMSLETPWRRMNQHQEYRDMVDYQSVLVFKEI